MPWRTTRMRRLFHLCKSDQMPRRWLDGRNIGAASALQGVAKEGVLHLGHGIVDLGDGVVDEAKRGGKRARARDDGQQGGNAHRPQNPTALPKGKTGEDTRGAVGRSALLSRFLIFYILMVP